LIQAEYKDIEDLKDINNLDINNLAQETKDIAEKTSDADNLLMRSIKIQSVPTLDKYVKRVSTKKKEEIIFPIQKVINLQDIELKNKGIKKKNITNKYEDN
jgi:hypothetical protein